MAQSLCGIGHQIKEAIILLLGLSFFVLPGLAQSNTSNTDLILQEEARYQYKNIPDIEVALTNGKKVFLSELGSDKPLLITLFFKDCTGACSPFLHSLKTEIDMLGGLGEDYHVLSLSFDPKDTLEELASYAEQFGIRPDNPWWHVGKASIKDTERISSAIGFWYKLDPKSLQFDHPTMIAAVRGDKIIRVLLGAVVSRPRFQEMIGELKGRFVPFYTSPGDKTIFRCLQVNELTQEVSLNWGLLMLLFPGVAAIGIAVLLFRNQQKV